MLFKKLVLVNTFVVIGTVAVLLLTSVRTFQDLCYKENSYAYQVAIDKYYQTVEDVLTEGKRDILTFCTDSRLHRFLEENHSARYLNWEKADELDAMETAFSRERGLFEVRIFPVNEEKNLLIPNEKMNCYIEAGPARGYNLYADIRNGYRWEFRPEERETIRITRQIFSHHDINAVLGIIRVDIDVETIMDVFWQFNREYGMDSNSRLYLTDEKGTVLLPYYSKNIEIAREDGSGVNMQGYGTVMIIRDISANDWKLVSQMENEKLLSGSREIILRTVILGAVLLALGITLTASLTRRTVGPVLELAQQMRNLQDLETYEEIPVEQTQGEVRILYQSFNHLIATVKRLLHETQMAAERRRQDEFRMLASQINPHFLYNTLGSIGWMAENCGATDIQEMTMDLVGMLRNGLNHGNIQILLRNEIEQVRCYVGIMRKRYSENYEFLFDIQEDTEDYWVIKQILQPLVENSIQYGLLEDDGGRVTVRAYTDREELVMEVRNTGKLADLSKINMLLRGDEQLRSRHYGIRNVNERLINWYGEQSGLRYHIEEDETVAAIRLPLERVKRKQKEEGDGDR